MAIASSAAARSRAQAVIDSSTIEASTSKSHSGPLRFVYGDYDDGGPEWDFDVDASMVAESFHNWEQERADTDRLLAGYRSPDEVASGNGRTVRWNLQKLVGEYARHNGHADLLRERIDGATGE